MQNDLKDESCVLIVIRKTMYCHKKTMRDFKNSVHNGKKENKMSSPDVAER